MTYLDFDDILCEEQKVAVRFKTGGAWNLRLFSKKRVERLVAGSSYEVPYWFALPLFMGNMVDACLPKFYCGRVKEELMISPGSTNLFEYSPYFYPFAIKAMRVAMDRDLYVTIVQSFIGRYKEAVDETKRDLLERWIFKAA